MILLRKCRLVCVWGEGEGGERRCSYKIISSSHACGHKLKQESLF